MSIFYVDGEFVDSSEAVISVNDIALLRGFGVFDFLRTYNRVPFKLTEHLERFIESGKIIGLDIPYSVKEMTELTYETIARNPEFDELNLRFIFTGGVSYDSVLPEGNGKFIIMASKKQELPSAWYSEGVKVITVDADRSTPAAKSINYLDAVKAQLKAKESGAIEAIYCDDNNDMLEGTTVNIFCIKDGVVITPEVDGEILPGITRAAIIELIGLDYAIEYRKVNLNEIADLQEVFISASNKEIVPVIQINDEIIGNGKVGSITKDIMDKFKNFTIV